MKLKYILFEGHLDGHETHEEKGFKFETNWGSFEIGDAVKLSDEAKDNDNYEDFFDEEMVITWVDLDDDGMGKKEPIMSFETKDGEEVPFSLYGYEIEKA